MTIRKTILLLTLVVQCLCCVAQYNAGNSFIRQALVQYSMGSDGYYVMAENQMVETVTGVVENYAYDPKSHNLFVLTDNANIVITLTNDYANIIKKNKLIPQYKSDQIGLLVAEKNQELAKKFGALDAQRTAELKAARDKVIADSINAVREAARQDSLKKAAEKQKEVTYKAQHPNWRWIPVKRRDTGYRYSTSYENKMTCVIPECEHVNSIDSVFVLSLQNDTVYYLSQEKGLLDYTYSKVHASVLPGDLLLDETFNIYRKVYSDSLQLKQMGLDMNIVNGLNATQFHEYVENLKKEAPYGFVKEWSWDSEYGFITFKLSYLNLNKKTIKYLDVYFKVTNPVGDVRATGNFKGTGPVEQFGGGSWDWDDSLYYAAGDASTMSITKMIITYMDGTKKILTEDQVVYDE